MVGKIDKQSNQPPNSPTVANPAKQVAEKCRPLGKLVGRINSDPLGTHSYSTKVPSNVRSMLNLFNR
ncbi:MAG: hypothetical protein NTZ52_06420 [Chlamydiae bacterium]|nr:hypothetical protein [Chlamydiota bacterium]